MMSEHRTYEPRSAFMKWLERRLPVAALVHSSFVVYPTPRNLNYWWAFGGILTFMLGVQMVTGIVLAMHYVPHVNFAFDSVERIMRDVNYGWLLRYIHASGASFFFVAVYIHMARGMYYGSYKEPREVLWILGVILFVLMIATGFVGYVLPWGQMSFWAATVITNLFSAIPVIGSSIVTWLWGGFAVGGRRSTDSTRYIISCHSSSSAWWCSTFGRCMSSVRIIRPASSRRPTRKWLHSLRMPRSKMRSSSAYSASCSPGSSSTSRTIYSRTTISIRQIQRRHRRISCRNGIICRSTRSCAAFPTNS